MSIISLRHDERVVIRPYKKRTGRGLINGYYTCMYGSSFAKKTKHTMPISFCLFHVTAFAASGKYQSCPFPQASWLPVYQNVGLRGK